MVSTTARVDYMKQKANAFVAPNPSPPELVRAISEIHEVQKAAHEARAVLADFLARMKGATDEEGACDTTKPSFGSGHVGDLRRAIEDTREVVSDLLADARGLRAIG